MQRPDIFSQPYVERSTANVSAEHVRELPIVQSRHDEVDALIKHPGLPRSGDFRKALRQIPGDRDARIENETAHVRLRSSRRSSVTLFLSRIAVVRPRIEARRSL